MKLSLSFADPFKTRTACLVLGAFADRPQEPLLRELDQRAGRPPAGRPAQRRVYRQGQ